MAIEPAAMLEPSFQLDRKVLDQKRRIQEGMLDLDLHTVLGQSRLENG